jgi:ribosomal protein S18 acetylase RimI-like enzyme
MPEVPNSSAITIRPARPEDADEITRTYIESAEHHARLDPERYSVPAVEAIAARYREGRQHPPQTEGESITLVAELAAEYGAELRGEIVGFVDARVERFPDPMLCEMLYCHIVEIAVSLAHQSRGIGGQLLRAAEDWGREHGADMAALEYLSANTRAGSFYEQRMGYRRAAIKSVKRL